MAQLKSELKIKFKRIKHNAVLPKTAHEVGDVGFDLCAAEYTLLPPGVPTLVSTGLVLADCPLEDGQGNQLFLDIRSRSGMAKKGIFPITGTVDPSYRGEIFVLLLNVDPDGAWIGEGDRIAQLVIQKVAAPSPTQRVIMEEVDETNPTERGSGGFGSTGT